MRARLQRLSVTTGFSLLCALLLVNAAVNRHRVAIQTRAAGWVDHSRQVLFEIEQAEVLLTDAETGQRGYLFTGDPGYLAPYQSAVKQIGPEIDKLAALTPDNPVEQRNVAQLRALAQAKLDELGKTVALARAGHADQARAVVLSGKGVRLMDNIRVLLNSMRSEEYRLDAERENEYLHDVHATVASLYGATAVAVLGCIALAFFMVRSRKLRDRHAGELREREERFRVTLTGIGDGVIATDAAGKVTFANPVAEQLIGAPLDRLAGRDIREAFPIFNEYTGKPAENPVQRVMEEGIVVGMANHTVLVRSDGTRLPIEDSAAPIRDDRGQLVGVVLVFHDATAARKAADLLRRTEKLAAAARLSATMAHEINNPLAAVMNLLYVAQQVEGMPQAAHEYLQRAEQELDRVAHITRQTLGFYRESKLPEPVDLAALIESVLRLYSNKLMVKKIVVRRNFEPCPPIQGLAGELRQAVSNLIANAIDAVEERGTISVALRPAPAGQQEMVEILVSDDGMGIDTQHADSIFEPFFTTKKEVGTGLGLWATRSIIERHGGSVRLLARSGGEAGAVFSIQLPRETDVDAGSADGV